MFVLIGSFLRQGFGDQEYIWEVMPGNTHRGRGKGGGNQQRPPAPRWATGVYAPGELYSQHTKDIKGSSNRSEGAGYLFTAFHQPSFESAFPALPACDSHDMQFVLFGINPIYQLGVSHSPTPCGVSLGFLLLLSEVFQAPSQVQCHAAVSGSHTRCCAGNPSPQPPLHKEQSTSDIYEKTTVSNKAPEPTP